MGQQKTRRGAGLKRFLRNGGGEGDRTPDLQTASLTLSQLSYTPIREKSARGEPPPRDLSNFRAFPLNVKAL